MGDQLITGNITWAMGTNTQPSPYANVNREIENKIAKKLEGKALVQVYMINMGSTWWIHRDYYFVRGGIIYIVDVDGIHRSSGDTFFQLTCDYKQVKKLL